MNQFTSTDNTPTVDPPQMLESYAWMTELPDMANSFSGNLDLNEQLQMLANANGAQAIQGHQYMRNHDFTQTMASPGIRLNDRLMPAYNSGAGAMNARLIPQFGNITNQTRLAAAEELARKAVETAVKAEAKFREEFELRAGEANNKESEQRNKAISTIHQVAKGLMGLSTIRNNVNAERLPDPVAPGQEPTAEDGSRLWRPDWNAQPSAPVNKLFMEEVVRKSREQDKEDSSQEERHELHNTATRRRTRVKKSTTRLRDAVGEVAEHYGPESVEGLPAIIHSDHIPSEHSDAGEVDKKTHQQHREQKGGGSNGLEIRPRAWHSPGLRRVFALLHSFSTRRERKLLTTRKAARKRGGSRAGKARLPRYKSLPQNINRSEPVPVEGKPPFRWMVSEKWLEKHPEFVVQANPPNFTIFDLPIPDEDLEADAKMYLLDAEDEMYLGDDEGDNE
ncbi:hypothetical protein C8R46DRAFT_1321671 [Mycena filopes]|nr:hypothetical protein C8R46DRAFT_1321671 [Mycena filopes]